MLQQSRESQLVLLLYPRCCLAWFTFKNFFKVWRYPLNKKLLKMKAYTVMEQPLSWAKILIAVVLYRRINRKSKANWGYKHAARMLHCLVRAPRAQHRASFFRKKGEGTPHSTNQIRNKEDIVTSWRLTHRAVVSHQSHTKQV